MSSITTHVLDAVRGKPANGIAVLLEKQAGDQWLFAGESATDDDGRCRTLCSAVQRGTYRLTFITASYFEWQNRISLYPQILIVFEVDGNADYHIPLLLSDNSYTTYRGS